MTKTTKALSLNIETLRELTLEDAARVNGGQTVSSVLGPPINPNNSVSSVLPPVHHHHRHH